MGFIGCCCCCRDCCKVGANCDGEGDKEITGVDVKALDDKAAKLLLFNRPGSNTKPETRINAATTVLKVLFIANIRMELYISIVALFFPLKMEIN